MSRIICHTKFKLDAFSDGGSKRSVQIRELLAAKEWSCEDDAFVLPKGTGLFRLVSWAFRAMGFIHRHYPKREIHSLRSYIRLVKYYALRIPVVYDKYKGQDVIFLWENTNDCDMLYLLKATGHPVIGLPHNIESLVSRRSVDALGKEADNLRHCDWVFTIAKEETWLFRLLGLMCDYLPYYPPCDAENYFLNIRKKRESRIPNDRKRFLLLGSATNPPTRDGMQAVIDATIDKSLQFDLCVAGYGTEMLKHSNNPSVSYFGSLSNDDLKSLLMKVDALIVYQPPTTGSLTRIPEMLLAGIPVFVNFNAARDYHRVEDVNVYSSIESLFNELIGYEPHQAKPLTRNEDAEKVFYDALKSLAENA